jgi:iron(III) transport system substrate-binding protein
MRELGVKDNLAKVLAGNVLLAIGMMCVNATTASAQTPPGSPALIAAAKKEGSVTLYGTPSVGSLKSDADAFQKTYGISLVYLQLTAGPMVARTEQEMKAGRFQTDIVMTADLPALERWLANKQLGKIPQVKFPSQTEYVAPVQGTCHALEFNTSEPGPRPKTWKDVLDKRYAGKVALGDPRISPVYSTLYYALLKDPAYGDKFFTQLATQRPRIVQTPALLAQTVASGEAALGFVGSTYEVANLKQQDAAVPIDYAFMDIVTLTATYMGVNAKPEHPNAAQLFAEWLMSPAGQIAHNGGNRAASFLGDYPNVLKCPAPGTHGARFVDLKDMAAEYQKIIALFDKLYK